MAGTRVRILLARHGETVFNVEGRWQGQSDSPLTDRGVAQARELARALQADDVAAVFTSDLGRAMTTAQEVAKPHGLAVIPDRRLREINVGMWTGKNGAEIDAEFPGARAQWTYAPAMHHHPGGETLAQVQARALDFVAEAMPDYLGRTVVVIGHGAANQTLLIEAVGRPVTDLWMKERIDNCQISRLEWSADEGLQLIELCDVRHLEEVGSLRGWRTDAG
jgi:broad specificity phosphatase PhoE